jgi:1-acyl-sn-glycerol-3-phosphate acyltransferase
MKPGMRIFNALCLAFIRFLGFFLVRLDSSEMVRLPRKGPWIIAMNHVNFLDGPLLLVKLFPRRVIVLAKKETWKNPIVGFIASSIGSIPLDRSGDPAALRRVATALEEGGFLYINPEGTRNRSGVLGKGKAGVVSIALATGAPVVPIGFTGLDSFGPSIRRLRRARVKLVLGEPFRVLPLPETGPREARSEAVDEIMYRIAALLPLDRRGQWSTPPSAFSRTETIAFPEAATDDVLPIAITR